MTIICHFMEREICIRQFLKRLWGSGSCFSLEELTFLHTEIWIVSIWSGLIYISALKIYILKKNIIMFVINIVCPGFDSNIKMFMLAPEIYLIPAAKIHFFVCKFFTIMTQYAYLISYESQVHSYFSGVIYAVFIRYLVYIKV